MSQASKRPWRHSIKGRLVALFILLALGTAVVFLLGMQRVLQGGWQAYVRPLVADYIDRLADDIGSPPDLARAQALLRRLPISLRIEGPRVQWDSHPQRRRRHAEDDDTGSLDGSLADPGWSRSRTTADGHRLTFGLAAPQEPLGSRTIGWATLAALLVLTALAYAAVRRQLAPLQAIGAGVEAYGRGEFNAAIAVQRRDELGDLAERINRMAANLGGMLDAKRALLLAISHELRSPLTRARLNTELLDDTPERSALLHDLGEMRDLITDLLESERLAQGHGALQPEAIELAALVRDVAAAQADGPLLVLQLDDKLGPVRADATRLRLLLRNLIENARHHAAGAAQPSELFLRRESDGRLALGLRDHGPGVAEDALPRLAEAFYRPDSARTRAAGGVGLGLYLCRLVAQAHGGELRIRNTRPGLEVAMVWRPESRDQVPTWCAHASALAVRSRKR